jgi:hypothetical protein
MKRVILAALALSACGPREVDYALSVVTSSCDMTSNPFEGVQFVRVRVTGDGLTTPVDAVSPASSRSLKLPEIPAGDNRVIEVTAFDADPASGGKIVSIGKSRPFSVPKVVPKTPTGPIAVSVVLRRVGVFTPVVTAANPTACNQMKVARAGHTATLLNDGRVFIAGGFNFMAGTTQKVALADAEIYDPETGVFAPALDISFKNQSGTVFKQERAYHTATLIPRSGQVVLWGGEVYQGTNSIPSPRASFLFYDPEINEYGALQQRTPPAIPRSHHQAAIDVNGKVLIAGGVRMSTGTPINEVEWLDPAADTYLIVDGANLPRLGASMSAVKNGEFIAIAGGTDGTTLQTEVSFFTFTNGTFARKTLSNPPQLHSPGRRAAGVATIHNGADMILLGGYADPTLIAPISTSEIVNSASATVANGPDIGKDGEVCAVTMANGSVFAVGGRTSTMTGTASQSESASQVVTANASGGVTTAPGPQLTSGRYGHTCTALLDGSVLITGGINETSTGTQTILQDAWIYMPVPPQ